METLTKKAKIHTVYKLADGTRVPSVSTILGELAKPALIPWAWKLGTQGIDYRKYRDALADIGTLAHAMILTHLRGGRPEGEAAGYPADQVSLAENCFLSYLNWEKSHEVEPIAIETPLVSEAKRYGGTADFWGLVDGVPTLIDYKTGSGIYPEHFIQLSAYDYLIRENFNDRFPVQIKVLNIPRGDDESFDEKSRGLAEIDLDFKIFSHARAIYNLRKGREAA